MKVNGNKVFESVNRTIVVNKCKLNIGTPLQLETHFYIWVFLMYWFSSFYYKFERFIFPLVFHLSSTKSCFTDEYIKIYYCYLLFGMNFRSKRMDSKTIIILSQ